MTGFRDTFYLSLNYRLFDFDLLVVFSRGLLSSVQNNLFWKRNLRKHKPVHRGVILETMSKLCKLTLTLKIVEVSTMFNVFVFSAKVVRLSMCLLKPFSL